MNYEKKYRDLVEAVKELQEANPSDDGIQNWVKENVPELKESEDERIRKEIINYFRCQSRDEPSRKDIHNKWIAWLEKQKDHEDELEKAYKTADEVQYRRGYEDAKREFEKHGEQKPADKVEPKFKVGDIVKHNKANVICKVLYANVGFYRLINILGGDEIELSDVEKNFHLWTIKDAKDGDVLHSVGQHSDCVFIFNGLDNWKFDEPDGERAVATGYCCLFISSDKMEFGVQGPDCVEVDTIKPATKASIDILFREMEKAGYEWNAEKKELKKVEQEYHCNGVREPKEATGVLKQLLDKENYVWSEEDKVKINRIVAFLKNLNLEHLNVAGNDILLKDIDWLKSLKDRYTWKPSKENNVEKS